MKIQRLGVVLGLLGIYQFGDLVFAATPISGSKAGALSLSESPYVVTGTLYVYQGQKLTIEPGVVVQFQRPDVAFVIDGTLIARGTSAQPILFTSDKPDKGPGQWGVMVFRDSSVDADTVLENCIVESGGASPANENVRFENASPTLRNCVVRQSRANGITFWGSDARVENCRFVGNGAFAMSMRVDAFPRLQGNTAEANGQDAIEILGGWTTRSGTWAKDNLPYTVTDYVGVSRNLSLTIQSGVVVQFRNLNSALTVDGTLVAVGTAGSPILFTSEKTPKSPGQWGVMVFRDSSVDADTVLENCIVESGGASPANENVRFENASPTLRNCVVRQSRAHGITFWGSDARVENCRFGGNGAFAMSMRVDAFPRLQGNTAEANGQDAIEILGGWTTRSGTWAKDNLPYTVTDYVGVSRNLSLTIQSGVVVQFGNPNSSLIIDGALTAVGTVAEPIRFTSDELVKRPGQWREFQFRDSAEDTTCVLEYCLIEYGGQQAEGNLTCYNASPRIANTTVRFSQSDGLSASGSSPVLSKVRMLNNGRDGIRTWGRAQPVITGSTLSGNAGLGINNLDSAVIIAAENNFWGHPSGPSDNANRDSLGLTNPAGLGDKVSEYVDWSPFQGNDPGGGFQLREIAASPLVLSFGNVAQQQSSELSLVVSNSGNAMLTINAVRTDNSQFTAQSTLPRSLSAGAAYSIPVRFAPTIPGAQTSRLSIESDDPARPVVGVSLSGRSGPAAGLLGEFYQFPGSLAVMPNVNGIDPDYAGAFTALKFTNTVQAFTSWDGIVPRTAAGKEFLDNFAVRFTGSLHISVGGDYLFAVGSDDGSLLKVNGEVVLDQNYATAYRTTYGAVTLPAGTWPIELDYFEQGVSAGLELSMTGVGPMALTTNRSPASLEVQTAEGFTVTPFAEGIGFPLGLAYSAGGAFGECLLVGDGESSGGFGALLKLDSGGRVAPVTTSVKSLSTLLVDPGSLFGGDLIAADDYLPANMLPLPGNRGIGTDRLKRIKPNGTVTDLGTLPGASGLAWGRGGFGTDLLVADSFAFKVFRVTPAGTITDVAAGRAFAGLTVTDDPAFGNAAYAGDMNGGSIIKIGTDGKLSLLATNFAVPLSLAKGQSDRLGADLFLSAFVPDQPGGNTASGASGVIYRVKADGSATVFASGLRFRSSFSGDLAFGFENDLFVLEDGRGRILRFSPGGAQTVPSIQVSPTTVDYGSVNLGQSKDLVVTVRNAGSAVLSLTTITSSSVLFTIAPVTLPATLAPGASTSLTVRFTPVTATIERGTLTIVNSDPKNTSASVALSGTGFSPAPAEVPLIQLSPGELDFGAIRIGQSRDLPVTIENQGSASLVISAMASDTEAFTIVSAATPIVLAPGRSTQITVRFAPSAKASEFGALHIASNDPEYPDLVLLVWGTGTEGEPPAAPSIQLSPAQLSFGSVNVGQAASLVLTVQNGGNAPLTVTSMTSDHQAFTVVASLPLAVGAGQSASVSVRFSPDAQGTAKGALTVTSNDPSHPAAVVPVSGTGVVPGVIQPSPSNLVAWWPAEGNGNDICGTNHGTLQSGASFASGKVRQAFSFDGTSGFVRTPLDVQPGAMPSTTWEAWVYPTRNQGRQQILSNDDGGFDRSVMVEGSRFGVFTGLGVWTPTDISLNQWQHIAVVYAPNTISFYKNGARFDWDGIAYGQATIYKLHIGRNPGFGEYFQGMIDEVSIYDRVLSSEEILAVYNAGSSGKSQEKPLANLLLNPGAEEGPGSATGHDLLTIPQWTATGNFTVGLYGGAGFPVQAESQRVSGGSKFFFGGHGSAFSSAIQIADVSAWLGDIDANQGTAVLQAHLGSANTGSATVQALFRGAQGEVLGGFSIGPVSASTNLMRFEQGSSPIPARTRSIEIQMLAVAGQGPENNVYIDNVLLGLKGVGTPAPRLTIRSQGGQVILAWPVSTAGFDVQVADSLGWPINWRPAVNTPVAIGNEYVLNVDGASRTRFYRLRERP